VSSISIFLELILFFHYFVPEMKLDLRRRVEAVCEFLEGKNVKEIANKFQVHPRTVKRWVKRYKSEGIQGLERRFPARRRDGGVSGAIAKKVVSLKEQFPSITLLKAREMLKEEGIEISLKGIWSIWKKYGFAGHRKERAFMEIRAPVRPSKEVLRRPKEIESLISSGEYGKATLLANELPYFPLLEPTMEGEPSYKLLQKLDFEALSPSRKLDLLYSQFGMIPYGEYLRKITQLREELEEKGLRYSALIAGILEVLSLGWMGEIGKQLKMIEKLMKELGSLKAPHLRFILLHSYILSLSKQLRLGESINSLRKLKHLLTSLPDEYREHMIPLLASLSKVDEAKKLALMRLERSENEERRKILKVYLAKIYLTMGEYREAQRLLKNLDIQLKGLDSRVLLIKAWISLIRGKTKKVAEYVLEALKVAKRSEIREHSHRGFFLLACNYLALNLPEKAKKIIETILPSLLETGNLKELYLLKLLLGEDGIPSLYLKHPHLRLAFLLKKASASKGISHLNTAWEYAKKKKILGLFHRFSLFFPEPFKRCLEKGIKPPLPTELLKLPLFEMKPAVYHINFIGEIEVYRNGERLRGKLTPKETSLFLFILLYPKEKIPIKEIVDNFWPQCKAQSRNLSRALSNLRNYLKIDRDKLKRKKNYLLVSFQFTTDFQYFREHLARARVYELTKNFDGAIEEYKKALSLVRGKPFERMYDTFAEDTRTHILSLIENTKEKIEKYEKNNKRVI